ncbi:hypothetical protein [Nannocystis sp. SCPEA4]|uniref:hypothetical protein n=1 Tax=Nannocystis sp. SCPEA4 TaxID=2996787 RepID=UPI002270A318|nr:hypothetical protein [Nannocystis sp. SCPEA4]MCY1060689.1 hypothetical protein [Nannocystis sp. SCPEA4]
MSLQSRGSRTVRIADEEWVWKIRRKATASQAAGITPMLVAVQRVAPLSPAVLIVDVGLSRPDNTASPHQTSVTPMLVRQAREAGWQPESGRGYRLLFQLIRDRP